MSRRLLSYALFAVGIAVLSGCASDFRTGMSAYRRKEFSKAATYLERAADQGDVRAQQVLGYVDGLKPDTSRISFKRRLAIKSAYENE